MRKLEPWRRAMALVFVFLLPAVYKVCGVGDAMMQNVASFMYGILSWFLAALLVVCAIMGEVPDAP